MNWVDSIPTGQGWSCEMVGLPRGPNGIEHEVELWWCDINECVAALLGNVGFQEHIAYKPMKIFRDAERKERLYGEAWTADWWWETQVSRRGGLVPHQTISVLTRRGRPNSPLGQQLRPSSFPPTRHASRIYLVIRLHGRFTSPLATSRRPCVDNPPPT